MAKSTVQACPQGLETVAEGVNPLVDIVAIHGLNGHRDKTWTAVNGAHWLRDLLPIDIPNARILCWGYDANIHGNSRVSCQYLYDHARSLVSDLCLERKLSNTSKRPIIFVAHSLGGIIVKSALIHSDAARKGALEEHRSIKLSTYGVVFMGTPHQGGNGVQLGKLLVNIASVFMAADDHMLKHLERDSEWLQQQLGQYGPISGDFVTKFAFEEYATPTFLGHSIMVVPRASAVVPGVADAEPIVIHADHINMVKFASKEDSGYRTVSGHLRIMAQDAGETISSRLEEERRVKARSSEKKANGPSVNQTVYNPTQSPVASGSIGTIIYHSTDYDHETLLHRAVLRRNESKVRQLLENKADANAFDLEDKTPLLHAIDKQNMRIITLLLEYGADVNTHEPGRATPLLAATYTRNVDIIKLLLENGADPNLTDSNGWTPMHEAIKQKNIQIIRELLQYSPDLSTHDAWGHSAFHLATIAIGATEILEMVLAKNPDIEARTEGGETPLHLATLREEYQENAERARLLLDHGADVNACTTKQGWTTLHKAAKSGNEALVRVLLEHGADPDRVDKWGNTAISQAGVSESILNLISRW